MMNDDVFMRGSLKRPRQEKNSDFDEKKKVKVTEILNDDAKRQTFEADKDLVVDPQQKSQGEDLRRGGAAVLNINDIGNDFFGNEFFNHSPIIPDRNGYLKALLSQGGRKVSSLFNNDNRQAAKSSYGQTTLAAIYNYNFSDTSLSMRQRVEHQQLIFLLNNPFFPKQKMHPLIAGAILYINMLKANTAFHQYTWCERDISSNQPFVFRNPPSITSFIMEKIRLEMVNAKRYHIQKLLLRQERDSLRLNANRVDFHKKPNFERFLYFTKTVNELSRTDEVIIKIMGNGYNKLVKLF